MYFIPPQSPRSHMLCPSNSGSQQLFRFGHDLILVGVQTIELDLQPIDRVDHRYCDHAGELPGGQLKAAGAGQLDGQDAKEERGKLLAQAGPDAATKRQVVEASLFVFSSLLTKAVWIEDLHILEDRCGVVGVSNAVHHTPPLGDLDTLKSERQRNQVCKYFCLTLG